MDTIHCDNGIRSYRINGKGVLRFNPADPNLYSRFSECRDKIRQVEESLADGEDLLQQVALADRKIKQILGWVFGPDNDFEVLLEGVNLLAVAGNGQPVIVNLFSALEPVLLEGIKQWAEDKTQQAVQQAQQRRADQ